MKKIALYPYDVSNIHLLLHKEMIDASDEDVIVCISPRGWGYEDEDAGYKIGIDTGFWVKSDFDGLCKDIDILIVTESILPLDNTDVTEKIDKVLSDGKRVIILRKMDAHFEKQMIEKSRSIKQLDVYSGNNIKLYSDIKIDEFCIDDIPVPIILVVGSGERCCKFDVQMDLRDKLIESGYKLTQIGSKNYCEFLGFHSFPMFMLDHNDYSERERIIGFNKYIRMLYMLENPDLIIIGVPGGVFPFDSYFDNNFGITNFFVSNAILPDYVIFNAIYVDDISEYLETVKSRVECRFNYEINQMFVSNYAFNYSVSLADKSLTYITCKTPDLLKRISGIDASNIYDSKQKECYVKKIIDTLHEYADVSVL